ncbi:MAG: class I SAM-dependent methyltransferase, partial [Deltaproteobacteria bacterium]
MVEIGEPDFFPVDDKNKTQTDKCSTCALRGPCPGLFPSYYESFGDAELRPVHDRPRSNSFNYVLERAYARITPEGCPVRLDGVSPWDRGRHVFVRKGDAVAVFRSDSRDFSDLEIEDVKHRQGQLYLDISDKPAPDDFARDLRQLRRSALCTGCPESARCAGMFEPVREDVFTQDDRRVREVLGDLTGAVLDIGCGESPYADALAPRAESGLLRYVGIDPDADRIGALRGRWPWAELHVGSAETADFAPVSFDHVLVLRSWNHLRDPARVLRDIARWLRPGGTLTVVDNVAFGLLRTRPQATRAESSRHGFEHFRNDSAAEACAPIAAAGFEIVERRDVGPETSNQWLLRARGSDAHLAVPTAEIA